MPAPRVHITNVVPPAPAPIVQVVQQRGPEKMADERPSAERSQPVIHLNPTFNVQVPPIAMGDVNVKVEPEVYLNPPEMQLPKVKKIRREITRDRKDGPATGTVDSYEYEE